MRQDSSRHPWPHLRTKSNENRGIRLSRNFWLELKFLWYVNFAPIRRVHQGVLPAHTGCPFVHPLSIYSTFPDVVNVLLISKSETTTPLTHHSHRLPVPYERVFLMLHIRLLITFRTLLCVISKHSLRARAKRPPSAVQLPPNVRLLGPITITTTRRHRGLVERAQVIIGKAVRAQWLPQHLALPLGHIIHPFTALQVTPVTMKLLPGMGPQFQISTHLFLLLLRPNRQGQSIIQAIHLFLLQCALLHQNHASRSRRQYTMVTIYNLKADIQIKLLRRPFLPTDEKTNELLSTKANKNNTLATWTSMVTSI
jgi:hypothetical protein